MPVNWRLGPTLPASRRGLLLSAPLLALPHVLPPRARGAAAAAGAPLLDQPMRRLKLPAGTFGRDYVLLQLRVKGEGPFDFMVDTGLTAELITPHLRQVCGGGWGGCVPRCVEPARRR